MVEQEGVTLVVVYRDFSLNSLNRIDILEFY